MIGFAQSFLALPLLINAALSIPAPAPNAQAPPVASSYSNYTDFLAAWQAWGLAYVGQAPAGVAAGPQAAAASSSSSNPLPLLSPAAPSANNVAAGFILSAVPSLMISAATATTVHSAASSATPVSVHNPAVDFILSGMPYYMLSVATARAPAQTPQSPQSSPKAGIMITVTDTLMAVTNLAIPPRPAQPIPTPTPSDDNFDAYEPMLGV